MKKIITLLMLITVGVIQAQESESSYYVVQNQYFPKADLEEEVLALRLEASRVRKSLGLVVGRVLENTNPKPDEAYVIWEAEYATLADRAADTAALEDSEAFKAIQEKMGTLLNGLKESYGKLTTPSDFLILRPFL